MTTTANEQLSAFHDDELDAREAELFVRRLARDTDLRDRAARYSLIGDAMRQDLALRVPAELRDGVAAAVDGEAAHGGSPMAGAPRARWFRPAAGGLVAASVALVALVTLQSQDAGLGEAPAETVVSADLLPTQRVVSDAAPQLAGAPSEPSAPRTITRYYLNHSAQATALSRQGQLIRLMNAEAAERPGDDSEAEAREDAGTAGESAAGPADDATE